MGSDPTSVSDGDGQTLVVLIVDDDPTNLFVLEQFLEGAGYPTLTATNGAEAVEVFLRERPRLILMDLSMPVMDGFEATRQILDAHREIGAARPVILAVSAHVTPEWRSRCLDAGMEDFIEKPIDFDMLIPRVGKLAETLSE